MLWFAVVLFEFPQIALVSPQFRLHYVNALCGLLLRLINVSIC